MAAQIFLSGVAGWVGSLLYQEAVSLAGVEDKVSSLVHDLQTMQWHLQHADANQERVSQVGSLIGQMRSLAYDAEDAIDAYIYKLDPSIANDHGGNDEQGSSSWRSWLMKYACVLYHAPLAYKVGRDIDTLNSRATKILQVLGADQGIDSHHVASNGLRTSHGECTSSIYPYENEGDYIVGLEMDIAKLIQIILAGREDEEEENYKQQQMNVVSVVGMGGSGKTTLARKLYNHPSITEYFDCRAWVYVSKEWTPLRLLSEILRQVAPQEMKPSFNSNNNDNKMMMMSTLEELAEQLRSILASKSYLLVLDDVWREQAVKEVLKALPCLNSESKSKSKIIITSRYRDIFPLPQYEVYIHESYPLNPDKGWELFSKLLQLDHRPCYKLDRSSYESLGKEMLKRCGGLPLAIVALAGILRKKETITEWQMVSKAVHSKLMEAGGLLESSQQVKIKDLLALSYEDLPCHLKACFLYLGAFPEDYPIPAGTLTRMWIAEGLVPDTGGSLSSSPEDKAMEYLYELSNRFMIQVARTNFKREIKAVCLHDLLHDLCLETAKEQSFLEINYSLRSGPATRTAAAMALAAQPRRVALHSSASFPTQLSHLRSLLVMTPCSSISPSAYKSTNEILNYPTIAQLKKFGLLRVLSLWGIRTRNGQLTKQIGKLYLLRYLSIRFTNITALPEAVGNLRSLLTLDYRDVVNMEDNAFIVIPDDVLSKLKRLRHLYLPINRPWRAKELKLTHLSRLHTLWGVKLQEYEQDGCDDNNIDWLATEMPKLSNSVKKLQIIVSTKEGLNAAFSCPSLKSDALHTFHCEIIRSRRSRSVSLALQDVEPLSGLQHLHKLILIGEIEMDLSILLPSKLIVLELKDSLLGEVDSDPMAALGKLAHLRLLRLENFYLGSIFNCGSGSFPQLEELYLARLGNLETWNVEDGAMLCLRKLEIIMCGKLKEFPQGLLSIFTLEQLECFEVSEEFRQGATTHRRLQQTFQLPHNCEAIIKHRDDSVNISSLHKLCQELTSGIFLSNKNKKYWIVKQRGRYNNCFMVYVKDLRLSCADGTNYWAQNELLERPIPPMRTVYGPDQLDTRLEDEGRYCEWSEVTERDGAVVTVAKVKSHALKFEAQGRIDSRNLSPEVTYEVAYVIMLEGQGHGWMMHVDCSLTLPDGSIQKHAETLNDKQRAVWVRVSVGEFKTTPQNIGEIEFSFYCERLDFWKVGLIIKGVLIEPKM